MVGIERRKRFSSCAFLHAARHKYATCLQRTAEKHVLRNCQFRNVLQFLVDHGDARPSGGQRSMANNECAIYLDVTRRRRQNSGKDVQHGGLAGTIFAQQSMDGAPFDHHIDAVEGAHRSEALADVGQFEPNVLIVH